MASCRKIVLSLLLLMLVTQADAALQIPRAIYTDPPRNQKLPARAVVLRIPTGGVKINGLAYLAEGVGPHPTAVFLIGLPGDEKNLDLAQAIRRAGWNAITFFYRGSWGSPGVYSLSHCLEDTNAVLMYLRAKPNAKALSIDTDRMVLVGHSMGGWIAAETAARDHGVVGAVLISAVDFGYLAASTPHAKLVGIMSNVMDSDSLGSETPERLAGEMAAHATAWRFDRIYGELAHLPLLIISADDFPEAEDKALLAALRVRGDTRATGIHMDTDHSYSDHRVALEIAVIRWLQAQWR